MDHDRHLGLFPLPTALLPGEDMPLHIFEPRYRQLYADCVLGDMPFVVVQVRDGAMEGVGCSARFTAVDRRHDDGRLQVVIQGDGPVRVGEPTNRHLYLSADVEPLADVDESDDLELLGRVGARFAALSGPDQELPPPRGGAVSYTLAGALPLDVSIKQALLNERSENARLALLARVLEVASQRSGDDARRPPHRVNGHGHGPINGSVNGS